MEIKLESLVKLGESFPVKLCELLPLGITLFEKKGYCNKAPNDCKYSRKEEKNKYFCSKNVNTFIFNLNLA